MRDPMAAVNKVTDAARVAGFTVADQRNPNEVWLFITGHDVSVQIQFIARNPVSGFASFHHAKIRNQNAAQSVEHETGFTMRDLLPWLAGLATAKDQPER